MAREAQRRGFRGFLVRVPGALVVGVWAVLFLGSFGVAALVDLAAEGQKRLAAEEERQAPTFRLDELLGPEAPQVSPKEDPFEEYRRRFGISRPTADVEAVEDPRFSGLAEELPGEPSALDSARNNLERAVRAERRISAGALGALLAWLLTFVFVTVGTGGWVTARDGWARVQSWHGAKLLMLYLPFTAAVALYAFVAAGPIDDAVGVAVLFITSALLLLACAAMLVRTTWNWFTGRETQRKPVGDGASHKPDPTQGG